MLCEKCKKNEASFYYHENVNGRTKTYRLCKECADAMTASGELKEFDADRYFEEFDSFFKDPFRSMDSLLAGFFGGERTGLLPGKREGEGQTEEKKCPGCGMTLSQFASGGRIGCPMCYETFEKELAPSISRVHGRGAYAGRAPAKFREKIDLRRRIENLEKEQKEAVRSENYERAAEIRDELKKLRAAGTEPSSDEAPAQPAEGAPQAE